MSAKNRLKASFFLPGNSPDTSYTFNRDHPNRQDVRDNVENLWTRYQEHCPDEDFLQQASQDFISMCWQMRLAVLMKQKGFSIIPTESKGPDLGLQVGKLKVWVEAVAPSCGEGKNEVRRPGPGQSAPIPEREIILRFTSAIQSKATQHKAWLSSGVVSIDNPFVIAICGGKIPDSDLSPEVSFVEKLLFGLGNFYWKVQSGSSDVTGQGYTERSSLPNSNGTEINTNVFLSNSHEQISGIFFTPRNIVNRADLEGQDFVYIHNPFARNPIPRSTFQFGAEKWVEEGNLQGRDW